MSIALDTITGFAIGGVVVFLVLWGIKCYHAKPLPIWPLLPPLN